MSVLNWSALFQEIAKTKGEPFARNKMEELRQLPIELVEVDETASMLAASLALNFELSHLDAFPIALARIRKATLVTTSHDLRVPSDVKMLIAR
jgi:predicted nucleic acid-binding protein